MHRLISVFGLFVLMALAWLVARDKRNINFRLIATGLAFQCAFALIIFKLPAGAVVFSWLNDAVLRLISFAKEGMYFLFGPLAVGPGETGPMGDITWLHFSLPSTAISHLLLITGFTSLLLEHHSGTDQSICHDIHLSHANQWS